MLQKTIKSLFTRFFLVILSSMGLSVISLLIAHNDKEFNYRVITFGLYAVSILIPVVFFLTQTVKRRHLHHAADHKNLLLVGVLVAIVEIVSFFALSSYPFVSLGDEVRDGGLDTRKIVHGQTVNIFAYGRYDAHGLIIPTIGVPFYLVFGDKVDTFRVYAAVLSILDITLLFILLRKLTNINIAFLGSLVLLALPHHLFFSRTQVVVAWNSLWMSALLLSLSVFFRKKRTVDYVLMGVLLGFSSTFHAAIRVVALLILLFIMINEFIDFIKYDHYMSDLGKRVGNTLLLMLFAVIGFGPKLLFTTPEIFFHTSRLSTKKEDFLSIYTLFTSVKQQYLTSLMGWFYEPVKYFYEDPRPLLTPFFAIIFLLGIGYVVFVARKRFYYALLFLVVMVPLFNSALTDVVNADHRMSVLLPLCAIFVALGIHYLSEQFRRSWLRSGLYVVMGIYIFVQIWLFFVSYPVNKGVPVRDFLSMHVIAELKKPSAITTVKDICIVTSGENAQSFKAAQYTEQYEYFLPDYSVRFAQDDLFGNNEASIRGADCTPDESKKRGSNVISCSKVTSSCPLEDRGSIRIFYE